MCIDRSERRLINTAVSVFWLAMMVVCVSPSSAQSPPKTAEGLLRAACAKIQAAGQIELQIRLIANLDALGIQEQTESDYRLVIDRPGRRLALRHANGTIGSSVILDGTRLWVAATSKELWTDAAPPASLIDLLGKRDWKDATDLAFFSLGGRAFPDALIAKDPYAYLMEGVTASRYLGEDLVNGQSCHWLQFEQDEVTWELWISNDEHLEIVRYMPDLRDFVEGARDHLKAQGQLTDEMIEESADTLFVDQLFSAWDFAPKLDKTDFEFIPSGDWKRVRSLTAGE